MIRVSLELSLNICFQFLNNIIRIFTYFFYLYIFKKNLKTVI